MQYSYEFKIKAVQLYLKGIPIAVPKGISKLNFMKQVYTWKDLYLKHGPDGLFKRTTKKYFSVDDKLEIIEMIKSGVTLCSVSIEFGISAGQISNWMKRYKILGVDGLVNHHSLQGKQQPKKLLMKDNDSSRPINKVELSEDELQALSPKARAFYEDYLRLKLENSYIKAEIDVVKKRIALREKSFANSLKAKKQQSSKNLVKKDTK